MFKKLFLYLFCTALVILANSAQASATQAPVNASSDHLPARAPRIGVVLGGGGARGFAHLGVLRELERLRIPIACIAGTSAGALIGGVYANGLGLDAMDEEFRQADWELLLSGRPQRKDIPFDKKRDDYRNYTDLTVGIKEGQLRVPRSAINSEAIDLFIRKLTRDRSIDSFDQLPIPFRAIATDLSNGQPVVFDRGELSTALRASMAVPGIFDLVEKDGQLLVDGGLARNLPIEDIKHHCADQVIVVDVGTPLLRPDQIHSVFDVVAQTTNLVVARNVREQLALLDDNDIVIRPQLDEFSSAAFDQNQRIIERGQQAARAMHERLASLSVAPETYLAWRAPLSPPDAPVVNDIKVVGDTKFVNKQSLTDRLQMDSEKKSLSQARHTLREIFAEGDFDRLTYRLYQQDGRTVMAVLPIERSIGPNYLRFGLELHGSSPGVSKFNLLASHLRTWANSAGASWHNTFSLGNDTLVRSEWYQPLSATSSFFGSLTAEYSEKDYYLYDPSHVQMAGVALAQTQFLLDGGVALGKYGEWRLGSYWSHYRPSLTQATALSTAEQPNTSSWKEAGIRTALSLDQFDNPRWPRAGYFAGAEVRVGLPAWGGELRRYYTVSAEQAMTLGAMTLRVAGRINGNIQDKDDHSTVQPQFLGGFLNLTGYQQNELEGSRTALARLMFYWRVSSLPSALGSGLYAGGSYEMGKLWQDNEWLFSRDTGWLRGGSLFLGADTLIGPMFVGLGTAQGGRLTSYLFLGVNY